MDKTEAAKLGLGIVCGIGIGKIIGGIIAATTPRRSLFEKLTVTSGAVLLASMVLDPAKKHLDGKIDRLVAYFEDHEDK